MGGNVVGLGGVMGGNGVLWLMGKMVWQRWWGDSFVSTFGRSDSWFRLAGIMLTFLALNCAAVWCGKGGVGIALCQQIGRSGSCASLAGMMLTFLALNCSAVGDCGARVEKGRHCDCGGA